MKGGGPGFPPSGLGGDIFYGIGWEGEVTLVGDTTWANDDQIHHYTKLNLAGYTLTYFNAADNCGVIYAHWINGQNGTITSKGKSSSTPGTGGTCNANNPNVLGGTGGTGAGAFWVYAKRITDCTIDSSGGDGVSLDLLSAADLGTAGGLGVNASGSTTLNIFGQTITVVTGVSCGGGGGNLADSGGAGGLGSVISNPGEIEIRTKIKTDLFKILFGIYQPYSTTVTADARHCRSTAGSGGGGGAGTTAGPVTYRGGGGGGGGCGLWGDGGAGESAPAGVSTSNFVCGLGSGGGGGAGFAFLMCEDASNVIVRCKGGSSLAPGQGINGASRGGRGGGGGGGIAMAIHNGGVTLDVSGGTGVNNGFAGFAWDLNRRLAA